MNTKTACIILLLIACAPPAAASSIVQLTNDSAHNLYPFWSPDGTEIAFNSFDDSDAKIHVMKRDGQHMRQVTDNHSWELALSDPWSPDGRHLLFISAGAGEFDLWTVNPDGTQRERLTKDGRIIPGLTLSGYGADWSPDGKQIVYTSCLFDNSAIWKNFTASAAKESPAVNISAIRKEANIRIMDSDGSNKRELTSGGDARSPQWQPYGDKIAYLLDTSGKREIWIMKSDGTEKKQVTYSEGNVTDFSWSPEGGAFAYVIATPPDNWPEFSIWTTNIDGSDSKQLTSENWDRSPVWSPDGTRLAFRSESRNQSGPWVIKSDGSALAPLTPRDAKSYMMQQWSPDGTLIAVSDGDELYTIKSEEQTAPASPGFGVFSAVMILCISLLVYISRERRRSPSEMRSRKS